jgi:hypothetical protein
MGMHYTASMRISHVPADQLQLLHDTGAQQNTHTGASLLAHLLATHDMLKAWGCAKYVCEAGLFHSIYGTAIFRHQSLSFDERDRVRAVISAEGEQLAWLFCIVDRPRALLSALQGEAIRNRLDCTALHIPEQQLKQLIEIEMANWLEQGGRNPVAQELSLQARAKNWLMPNICAALDRHHAQKMVRKPMPSPISAPAV